MSRGINKIILIGNLGQDPEKVSDNQITKISVATSEKWKDKESGEQKEHTEWHRVTFFGHLANSAMKYLYKGAKIYIEGSNRTNKWEKDGQTHYTTEIHVRAYLLLSENKYTSGQHEEPQQKHQESKQNSYQPEAAAEEGFDEDVPF